MPLSRHSDDEDDYDPSPARRRSLSGVGIGALAGVVGGEGALIFADTAIMNNVMGRNNGLLVMMGLCFLICIAPVFMLLGICGSMATTRTRSTALGILIGAIAGPLLVFVLWGCGVIITADNNRRMDFNLSKALWCSALLCIPGAVGALFTGLLAPGTESPRRPRSNLGRYRDDDDELDDVDRERHRRRE